MTRSVQQRVRWLMVAGWIDSLCLSFAWTLLLLEVVERHGLRAAGVAGAAMLVGTAMSAPVASQLSVWLGGRHLLRTAGTAEAVLRVSVFGLLFLDVGVWPLALCIAAMNITAWTGYAGMRAEVAAIAPGPKAITWYGTGVAAVEAMGAAAAAVLIPSTAMDGPTPVALGIVVVYVLALAPTMLVAGGSPIVATGRATARAVRARPTLPLVAGVSLMLVASAPTLLAVALAADLHGRSAVAPAAVAFTIGSLTAPYVAGLVERRAGNGPVAWTLCATGMVLLWPLASLSVAWLCAAQLLSGLFMTTLEGLLDTTTAARATGSVTGALARGTAGRALGSAAGTAALPVALVGVGLAPVTGGVTLLLGGSALALTMLSRRTRPTRPGRLLRGPASATAVP